MRRREILKGAASVAGLAGAGLSSPAIAQGAAKTLRFVPQDNLANPDPIWTTATVAVNHGYMVFDTLYGIDDAVESRPEMCAGHEVSSDELTWTSTLRDGLMKDLSRCHPATLKHRATPPAASKSTSSASPCRQ
jgi:peptide/nickel transport system substrate-binding protein